MSLYRIFESIVELFGKADEETGELPEEAFDQLIALQLDESEKIDGMACYVKNLDAEAEAINSEIQQLTSRLRSKRNAAERAKDYLKRYLEFSGKKKFESPRCRVSFRRSTAAVVDRPDEVPEEFLKAQQPKINLALIKQKLALGETYPFAHLEERNNIQIR